MYTSKHILLDMNDEEFKREEGRKQEREIEWLRSERDQRDVGEGERLYRILHAALNGVGQVFGPH